MATACEIPQIKKLGKEKWVFADFFFLNNNNTTSTNNNSNNDNSSKNSIEVDEHDELLQIVSDISLTANENNEHNLSSTKSSKKKMRKKNKKQKRAVRFGTVEISVFLRDIAFSSVPSLGSWPLGMSYQRDSVEIYSLLEYETSSAESKHSQTHDHKSHNHDETALSEKDELDTVEVESRMARFSGIVELVDDSCVRLVNHEIDSIQKSRKSDKGCSCKPLKIDKLSVQKLKSELHKANINDINDLNKTQLTKKLKDVLKGRSCQICTDSTCPCVLEEHNCNASICDCLRKVSKTEICCSNPFGRFICDPVRIQTYREKYLVKQLGK